MKTGIALLLIGLTAGTGLLYRTIGEYRDRRRFPLKGSMIAVDLHKMHLYYTGHGEPAVILEAPQTGLSATWWPVQKAVSRFAKVCSYDRAGFGWSEPGPLPRTSERIAFELRSLLAQAGVPPPYVLVGASAGGFPVRIFADRFPAEVAGVVLVDSSDPDAERLGAPRNPAQGVQKWEILLPLMHQFGALRLGLRLEVPRPPSFSPDAWDELLYLRERMNSWRALLREGEAWAESADQVRKCADLGTRPLLVLSGSRDADAAWRAAWVDGLQAEMAHLSSRGRQVVLSNSGHGIQFDAPDAVANAIHEICNAVHAD